MVKGRLTRDELEGLLAQEAKGAARSLRADLDETIQLEPEDRPSANLWLLDRASDLPLEPRFIDAAEQRVSDPGVPPSGRAEVTSSPRPRSRRGRLDLAALVCEFAPQCRISLEPGAGTEVVGHENDLRRALQLMLLQDPAAETHSVPQRNVEIRRDGEWIRVNVDLGPDIAVVNDVERRWLHRVAIRHGGRFELGGNTQSLLLPADASAHAEVQALQKELEQAQLLGETYARELATAFSEMEPTSQRPSSMAQNPLALMSALQPLVDLCVQELASSSSGKPPSSLPALRQLQQFLQQQRPPGSVQPKFGAAEAERGVQTLISALAFVPGCKTT